MWKKQALPESDELKFEVSGFLTVNVTKVSCGLKRTRPTAVCMLTSPQQINPVNNLNI